MLSRKHIALITLAIVAGAAIIVTQTASSKGHAYKLEGAWTCSGGGLLGNFILAPSEPSGRKAAGKVNWVTVGPTIAWLQSQVGADGETDSHFVTEMISRDTAKFTMLTYWTKTGLPNEIKMIVIDSGIVRFTGPDSGELTGTTAGYLPSRDTNGDGLPDDLDNPPDLGPFPADGGLTRIPMLP